MKFKIREPIWKGRKIGLAESKLGPENEITIDYRLIDGSNLYPYTYTITKEKAMTYPVQVVRGQKLRIIPIVDLGIKYGVEVEK